MPSTPTSEADAHTLVGLLRSAPFSAPYLGETLDWIQRECRGAPESTLQAVAAYSTGRSRGCAELAERLADARHAVSAVWHHHYLGMAIGRNSTGASTRVFRGADVRKLATGVGRSRVVAGPTGVVVLTSAASGSTVFRPVGPELAHELKSAARRREKEAARRADDVRRLLGRHVQLADWGDPGAAGVAVDSGGATVTVYWWNAHVIGGPTPWTQGGLRLLCEALLADHGYTVAPGDNNTFNIA